jgi:PTH1 family peptidyl-tRNA hydrolase
MNYLIVGLGNPGKKYSRTRHNIGFMLTDMLSQMWQASAFTSSGQADAAVADVIVNEDNVLLVKPQTFMNKSGEAVAALVKYFDIKSEHILVVYDDVDLPLGTLRFVSGRGSGGHRGVQSVIDRIGKDFSRLRIGISPTDADGNVEKQTVPEKGINPFVIGKFTADELLKIENRYTDIKNGIEQWIAHDNETAANLIN